MLQIQKRDNNLTSFNPSKILSRIKKASKGLKINADEIFIKVITSVPTEGIVTTRQLDTLIAETSAPYASSNYDYSKFAAQVSIAAFKKDKKGFSETMKELHDQNIVHPELIGIINNYGSEVVDSICVDEKDEIFDYFAWKTLETMYLLKNNEGEVKECPQYMYLRIALWLTDSLEEAKTFYNDLSNQLISAATPIMLNSGTTNAQLSSCVLHYNDGDSREELLDTLRDISLYSSSAAGIGLCLSNVRSCKSRIAKSGGLAGGVLKYSKIVNEALRFFNQNGKRPGSAAIYLEPWHKDIFHLLGLTKKTGMEEMLARDVFTALWIPDNFMRAVETDSDYYLFCPNDILKAGLKPFQEIYGAEFEEEYQKAVDLGIGEKVKAMDIWHKILESQMETGLPYILFKDAVNEKSNHKNIGTIKQSNLCAEVIQFTDELTTAICTLASMILKNFIINGKFDFELLREKVGSVVEKLNKVIDINHYTTEKGKKGGMEQRALAIGVQGLADTIYTLDMLFTSDEAKKLNRDIAETIYYAALRQSCDLVKSGKYEKYKYFDGSPLSQGIFQFDMWKVDETGLSGKWDWEALRQDIIKYGVCNSLLVAYMPTASSAKITGSYESFEPADSNLFNRKVLGGNFLIPNKYLMRDLENIGIWSDSLKNDIILSSGSIQNINFLKYLDDEDKKYESKVKRIEYLMKKYKTVWEHSQRELIDLAAIRAPFIDQTQSMNIYMQDRTASKITSSHFYAWKKGLKTGCYYLRTKAVSTGAKHLAIDLSKTETITKPQEPTPSKPEDSQFECFGCSA